MPFDQSQINAIIREYNNNKASLGRYPPPTPETISVIDAVMALVAPLDLIDGKADIDDELGHIAMSVFHITTAKIQRGFIVAFSGGSLSKPNFQQIKGVINAQALALSLNMPNANFQFLYDMPSPDIATWPCAEPKALVATNKLNARLLGFACRWYTRSQLTTSHRLNISFVSARETFMLPCEHCLKLFGAAAKWPNIQV